MLSSFSSIGFLNSAELKRLEARGALIVVPNPQRPSYSGH